MNMCTSVHNDIIGSMYSMGNDVCVCMGMKNSVVLLVPLNMSTQISGAGFSKSYVKINSRVLLVFPLNMSNLISGAGFPSYEKGYFFFLYFNFKN